MSLPHFTGNPNNCCKICGCYQNNLKHGFCETCDKKEKKEKRKEKIEKLDNISNFYLPVCTKCGDFTFFDNRVRLCDKCNAKEIRKEKIEKLKWQDENEKSKEKK